MKKTIILFAAIAAISVLVAFTNSENQQEILSVRVTEKFAMSGTMWKSELIVIEPNREAIVKTELGSLPKENISNLSLINKTLNEISAKGWKLQGISTSSSDSQQLVTLYTFVR